MTVSLEFELYEVQESSCLNIINCDFDANGEKFEDDTDHKIVYWGDLAPFSVSASVMPRSKSLPPVWEIAQHTIVRWVEWKRTSAPDHAFRWTQRELDDHLSIHFFFQKRAGLQSRTSNAAQLDRCFKAKILRFGIGQSQNLASHKAYSMLKR